MGSRETDVPFAGCLTSDSDRRLVLFGVCDDTQSSYRKGVAEAPPVIRTAYDGDCYNSTTETGVDMEGRVFDAGDLRPSESWGKSADGYSEVVRASLADGKIPFIMGGDHAVTVPLVAGYSEVAEAVHVVQIDAHPDLYHSFQGSRDSHACVAARLLEMDHIATVHQLGIRAMNSEQQQVADENSGRLFIYPARELPGSLPLLEEIPPGAPVYLTVDLDAFDPAYSPGVSHPVPGGLTPRQVLCFLQSSRWRLVGMDAVEVNPSMDVNNQTAILAGRLLHEAMGTTS